MFRILNRDGKIGRQRPESCLPAVILRISANWCVHKPKCCPELDGAILKRNSTAILCILAERALFPAFKPDLLTLMLPRPLDPAPASDFGLCDGRA
jgi:hypothetical protein